MKKLTILLPDDVPIEFSDILNVAIEFKMENIPDPAKPKRIGSHHKHVDRGMSTTDCILAHYTPSGVFTKDLVMRWMEEKGFARTSAGPALTILRRKEHIEDLNHGRYRWLKGA